MSGGAVHIRQPLRRSSDLCWPLRDANGRTWAERKAAAPATAVAAVSTSANPASGV